jgi:uncharacterized damage-inducible protein DinB
MIRTEYEWVKQTRQELLDFCSTIDSNDFTRHMGFGWQSIRDSLVHVADCYCAWLGSFVLLKTKSPLTSKEDLFVLEINDIRLRFEQVDSYVNEVFETYSFQLDEPIIREIPWRTSGEVISMTSRKLLLHVMTHEFHHKGQIVAMARQLGYEPPNTDVLGTED